MPNPRPLRWRKSTFSGNDANCVELAWPGSEAAIRDSKSPHGALTVPASALTHLLSHTKHR